MSSHPTPQRPTGPAAAPKPEDTGRAAADTANTGGAPCPPPELREGGTFLDYTLVKRLGRGGFGEVWRARDTGGSEVALKFVALGGKAGDAELRALKVTRNVRHPHLLPVFRTWLAGDWLVLALELADQTLAGRLGEALEKGLPGIPRRELLKYLGEAAEALDHLHALKIQHRDVKPANLLLVSGSVKVADFGLAKALEQSQGSHTGGLSPAYAAPEFMAGRFNAHSDQYSLAVSYCQLRGGRLPFAGSPQAILLGHLTGEPDLTMLPPAERPPVGRALAKEPEHRYPDCAAFAAALAAPREAAPAAPAHPKPAPARAGRRRSWYPAAVALLLAAVTVVACLTAVLLNAERRRAGSAAPPAPAHGAGTSGDSARTAGAAPAAGDGGTSHPAPGPAPPERPPLLDCTGPDGVSAAEVRQAQEAWAKYLRRRVEKTVEVADGVTMTFVLVPPGKFRMGSPEEEEGRDEDEALHEVTLTEPFDLGQCAVTQAQFEALTGRNPSDFKGSDRPVDQVNWEEAQAFGRELTSRRSDGHVYRLPTEAEREYACRGGRPSATPFGIGDGRSLSSREANFDGRFPYGSAAPGPSLPGTCKVGAYAANAAGLYDLHGNVMEWCADRYGPYPDERVTNPAGPADGSLRVLRGGAWYGHGSDCRAAYRVRLAAGFRGDYTGFRLARTIPPAGR